MLALATVVVLLGATPVEEAKSSLRALEKKYSVDIQWEYEFKEISDRSTISTRKPLEEDLVGFAPKLAQAMKVYPASLWKAGRIKTIVLSKQVLKNGVSWGGMAVYKRTALLLDVSATSKDDWLRTAFHHEVYHLIDRVDEADWAALNPEKFAYRPVKASGAVDKTNSQAGFVSAYARTGAGEDRAELFAFMVATPKVVRDQVKRDDLLRGKVAAIKTATAAYGLDAAWWKKLGF